MLHASWASTRAAIGRCSRTKGDKTATSGVVERAAPSPVPEVAAREENSGAGLCGRRGDESCRGPVVSSW
jgi:hypothetical protein